VSDGRVVITGIGVVSSIARGTPAFLRALREGRSCVSPIRAFNTMGYPYANATEVQDLGPGHPEYDDLLPTHGRSSIFALLAAREAVEDAQLSLAQLQHHHCGVTVGTTDGESQVIDHIVRSWHDTGPHKIASKTWAKAGPHRISQSVAHDMNLPGETLTIATACAAGNYAIGHAYDLIRAGEAEVMLCGGSDSVCRKTFTGFFRLGAITPDVCRPFDTNRKGILTGEGAAMLMLESRENAQRRGAEIYAEILGYGVNCDATHMVAPDRISIAECIRIAHRRAGISPSEVDLISAHGTGTRTNDQVESSAIQEVFGERLPPTISIKSMIGHTMGAASAMGAVACALALKESFIPPTINFSTPDPACPVDCIPNKARHASLNVVQNNGFAFGGNNAILILKRVERA